MGGSRTSVAATTDIATHLNPADPPVWRRAKFDDKFDDMFDEIIESLLKYPPR
jgi:hypothetical protein